MALSFKSFVSDKDAKLKAGLIPYFKNKDDKIEMLFMIASDPSFGGYDPMISKGHIDDGEIPEVAAIREAEEELGFKTSNMVGKPVKVDDFHSVSGNGRKELTYFFAVEVKSKTDFDKFHYETGSVHWMTNDEFQKHGRPRHRLIVQKLYDKLKK